MVCFSKPQEVFGEEEFISLLWPLLQHHRGHFHALKQCSNVRKMTKEAVMLKKFVFTYLQNGRVLPRAANLIASNLVQGHGGRTPVERAILREVNEILAEV